MTEEKYRTEMKKLGFTNQEIQKRIERIKKNPGFVSRYIIGGLKKVHLMPTRKSLKFEGYADASVNTPSSRRNCIFY